MNQDRSQKISQNPTSRSDQVNLKKLFRLIGRNWFYYLIAFIIAGSGAYFFLEYTIPTYRVDTTILIEEESTPGQDLLEGFAVSPGRQNLDNQVLIISSYSLVRKVVEELPFETDIYWKGLLSQASYYPLYPIRIEPGPEGLPNNVEFTFEHAHNGLFHLSSESNGSPPLDTLLSFGQVMEYNGKTFSIHPQQEHEAVYKSGTRIYFQFYSKERLTNKYQSRLLVERATRDGTIIKLSLEGSSAIKDVIFLDKLTEVYINNGLEKKNQEAKRVIEFIDAQLIDVSDSLMLTETQLQEFRSRERIMDVSAQAQQIINQATVLENERARLNLNRNYFDYLEEYLSKDDNEKAPVNPASMGIDDPLLANLMQELSGLQAQYFSGGVGERNPLQGQLETRMKNTKESIRETLAGIMLANQMAIEENTQQINRLNSEASRLPVKERQLIGFERKFNLNNVLYTFLLQRRAEAQIQKASNAPDNELVDPARAKGPVWPNMNLVVAIALFLALAFPTLLIVIIDSFRNRIASDEDIKLISTNPIVAHFPHNKLKYYTIVFTEPGSNIAEAFRNLRTRMKFFTKDVNCPLIVISSSMPGDGKTFTSINLAASYSLTGKKTVLVGFDMRRPSLSKSFDLNGRSGLTDYLIGKNSIDEIISRTDYENLSIIPTGPIPPNPGELSTSEKVTDLINSLRQRFDYILVDSAPIGVVSDIYSLAHMADALLLVVRHSQTKKYILNATISEMRDHEINNFSIIVNDIKSTGSNYKYTYKYKYEYKQKRVKSPESKVIKVKKKEQ